MDGEAAAQWERVREILHGALELLPEERGTYLDSTCKDDAALRAEVESLLAASDGTAWIDQPADVPAEAAAVELEADRQIGPYRIIEKIGAGGMGVVYKAVDTRLDRTVALKVLPHSFASSRDKNRFIREAKSASSLNHPGIVTIYEFDSADGVDFIAIEYVPGQTLQQLLVARKMPLKTLLEYARQVAAAVAAAHAARIVHRDLKPNNIVVTPEGTAKVLDFGIARRESRAESGSTQTQLTRAGVLLGTPAYMSPEQATGELVDYRTDIFSFGVILYQIAGGKRPFEGANSQATLHRIATIDPPALKAAPKELARLIQRCLKKRKGERLQSMAEAAAMLDTIIRARERALSRRGMLAAGILVAVALGGGVWYSRHAAPSRERSLVCWLEAQKLDQGGHPLGQPHLAPASESFEGRWRFRVRAESAQPGYLYLVDDAGDQMAILYPPGGGPGSPLAPKEPAFTGWYRLEGDSGTDRLWVVWTVDPPALLGQAGSNIKDPSTVQSVRAWLARLPAARATPGEPSGAIQLRGAEAVLGANWELRHR